MCLRTTRWQVATSEGEPRTARKLARSGRVVGSRKGAIEHHLHQTCITGIKPESPASHLNHLYQTCVTRITPALPVSHLHRTAPSRGCPVGKKRPTLLLYDALDRCQIVTSVICLCAQVLLETSRPDGAGDNRG